MVQGSQLAWLTPGQRRAVVVVVVALLVPLGLFLLVVGVADGDVPPALAGIAVLGLAALAVRLW